MTYFDLISKYKDCENVEVDAIKFIITEYNQFSNLPAHLYDEANAETVNLVNEYINGKSPQYLIGRAYFYGLKLKVTPSVLIPRFDTEVLVDYVVDCLKKYDNPKVLDGFTGSGAIALAIKNNNKCSVDAFDISDDALNIAKENARDNNLDVNFFLSDKFENVKSKYDIFTANPPYIKYGDPEVEKRVFDNEPNLALYADDNGMYFYKYIIDNVKNIMNNGFMCFLEIPYNAGEYLKDYAVCHGFKTNIKKDLAGRDRVLILGGK